MVRVVMRFERREKALTVHLSLFLYGNNTWRGSRTAPMEEISI